MPKTKQTTRLETRLKQADRVRFDELVRKRGVTNTEFVREALLYYLDHCEANEEENRQARRDRIIAGALKSIENRFASLMVRLGVDVESLYALLWASTPVEDREELFEECRKVGLQRFKRKLLGLEEEFKRDLQSQPDTLAG